MIRRLLCRNWSAKYGEKHTSSVESKIPVHAVNGHLFQSIGYRHVNMYMMKRGLSSTTSKHSTELSKTIASDTWSILRHRHFLPAMHSSNTRVCKVLGLLDDKYDGQLNLGYGVRCVDLDIQHCLSNVIKRAINLGILAL